MSKRNILKITLPKNNFPVSNELKNKELRKRLIELNDPLILVIGWAGGIDKYVSKYSDIWEEKNCITARYCVSAADGFSSKDTGTLAAANIVEELQERLGVEKRPVLIHSFSNGGGSIYRRLVQNDNYKELKIIGSIIDSAPGKRRLLGGINAVNSTLIAMNAPLLYRYAKVAVFILRSVLKAIWQTFWGKVDHVYKGLIHIPVRWPEGYIYSEKDDVIYADDVREFIDNRKRKAGGSFDIETLQLKDSDHVQHLRKYPILYKEFCFNFFDKAFTIYNQNAKL
ncbi:DgyrCDS6785 [Dimorphilus gyrociliatus]|uniref:DgyrCDS6785 n=1 Tax=Dimorphilus gyrociliatus TaxID=2664684 RepID=A0A7I8VTW0_9ANNE|nr:DgyrCDS6785 [Dimorphilus gyrociliatus]